MKKNDNYFESPGTVITIIRYGCKITLMDAAYKKEVEIFSSILTKPIRQNILRDYILNVFSQTIIIRETRISNLEDDFSKQYLLRILMAEDNFINQKIAVKILDNPGYQHMLANK